MGAWGCTAWANDSALDWVGVVGDKITDEIELQIKGMGNYPCRHKVVAAGDLLNQLTPYTYRKDPETGKSHKTWGGGPLGIHFDAESKKLFSRMIAQLECIRADENWMGSWVDGGDESKAEVTRIINALRRKVKHER